MEQRFRNNYEGEFVVLKTIWKDGRKYQEREYIPNPIENQHISGRAAVIGADESARENIILALENHKGGLLGQKRLQTYGCDSMWKKMRLHFCWENDQSNLQQIIDAKYNDDTVVYSSVMNCMKYPGNFYIVPYGVKLVPCAQAAYLAAFDGHKEVFLLGVDSINHTTLKDPKSIDDLSTVFRTYDSVTFYFVTDSLPPCDGVRNHKNVKVVNYKWFINYCDV